MEGQTSSDILCSEINAQSRAEAATVLEQAEKEASKIIKDAEKQAARMIDEWVQKAENSAESIRRRILSGVHLEVKKQKLRAREEIIRSFMHQLSEKMEAFRHEPAYQPVLEKWIIEGALSVDDETLELACGDIERKLLTQSVLKSLAEKIQDLKKHRVTLKLSDTVQSDGGVIVASAEGRTRFDNRFSARMRRNEDAMRLKIMNTIFIEK